MFQWSVLLYILPGNFTCFLAGVVCNIYSTPVGVVPLGVSLVDAAPSPPVGDPIIPY